MQHVGGVYVLQPTKDLIYEGLKMGVGQGLTGPDDGGQVTLHEFWRWSIEFSQAESKELTFIEVGLIEFIGFGYVHVI